MLFSEFIKSSNPIAMVISIDEYRSVKSTLQKFYTEKDLHYIDDEINYRWGGSKFLLCNPANNHPYMLQSAVTFIDRVPFRDIVFEE